jgi:PIN domain nuclease of toxin-antitoxin system
MRLLLDTHILLWFLAEPKRLSKAVIADIEDPSNEILFSAASIWELAIKASTKKSALPLDGEEVFAIALETGFRELPVRAAVARHVANLPFHHRDPFDRLLVAQAISEPAILYTDDAVLEAYSELVKRV